MKYTGDEACICVCILTVCVYKKDHLAELQIINHSELICQLVLQSVVNTPVCWTNCVPSLGTKPRVKDDLKDQYQAIISTLQYISLALTLASVIVN